MVLEGADTYLKGEKRKEFYDIVLPMMQENMKRIYDDVAWFIEKYDYKNKDADWIEIDPTSVENTDNKVVSTKVSVVVKKNTDKERSAEIKLGAEGVDPVVITVKQSAEVAEESVLCVWDMDKFVPFENPTISADFYAAELSFVVHANVDWTATCPSWITLDPTSNKYDGQTQNVTVKAVIAANDEADARTGEIKFVGEGVADLVIPVSQAKAARVKLTLKEMRRNYVGYPVGRFPTLCHSYFITCISHIVKLKHR